MSSGGGHDTVAARSATAMSGHDDAAVVLHPSFGQVGPAGPIDPDRVFRFLEDPAVGLLVDYFLSGRHSGGRFDRFGGGGDQGAVANQFTSDDLVAVSLLGARLHGQAVAALLDGTARFCGLLSEIPGEVDLWQVSEPSVGPGSPVDRLWWLLIDLPRVNHVTAAKLLAGKRPRLIPLCDRIVLSAVGRSVTDEWWRPLRTQLVDNPALLARLDQLRALASIGDDISLLRVLDACIWMQARPQQSVSIADR